VPVVAPPFPAGGRTGLVHDAEPEPAELDARDLGQTGPDGRPVVVAVHPDQARGSRLDLVDE